MQTLLKDLQYGFRMLLKNPGTTAVAMLALSLSIGANTAIFSVVNSVLLRPMLYHDSEHLMVVWATQLSKGIQQELISAPDFKDWAEQNRVFDRLAAIRAQAMVLTGGELPERVETAVVSPSVFELLGVKPAIGRTFFPEEDQPGKNRVAVISQGLWKSRFGGDLTALGKSLIVDGNSVMIIGVMPAGFRLIDTPSELWMPYSPEPKDLTPALRGIRTLKVIAHLKPGVSPEQAGADMRSIASRLELQYADVDGGWGVRIVPLREQLVGNIRTTLWTLLGAVAFVLLIACANVANLLLARAGSREKEVAIRTALGANPFRLARQLLTESILLSVTSGVVGVLLAYGSAALLTRLGPAELVRAGEIVIDWRVLLFTLLVAVSTGILFGLAPALTSVKADVNSVLRTSGRSNTSSRGRANVRSLLVICEIGCCVVLMIGAGLHLRSFMRLEGVNPGFRTDHVLTMQIALPKSRYSGLNVALFYKQLIERLQRLPGLRQAGVARDLPFSGGDASLNFVIENAPILSTAEQPRAKYRAVSADYFAAMGIPLIRGRYFNQADGEKTPGVVIINAATARRFWPGQDPIGKRMKAGFDESQWCTIVGIVGDVKHRGLDAELNAETYYHYLQVPPEWMNFVEGTMTIVLRTQTDPAWMVAAARNEVQRLDKNQPVFNVKTVEEMLHSSVAQPRFRTLLMGIFAGVAMLLAGTGLYGVIAYSVSQRISEIGVRIALGAQKSDVLKLIVGHGAQLAGIGIGIGLVAAVGLTRIISKLLFGVNATDPLTFAAMAALLLLVALAASYIPARKAIKLNPIAALHHE